MPEVLRPGSGRAINRAAANPKFNQAIGLLEGVMTVITEMGLGAEDRTIMVSTLIGYAVGNGYRKARASELDMLDAIGDIAAMIEDVARDVYEGK